MLNEIVDVYGLRIVVDRADTCYRALGAVHSVFKPMPGRFKDYIAIPRVNGYQSLHTTLFGPNGVPIEVQIRTEDMHRVAESGIAAHWKYKTGAATDSAQQERTREWLSNLVSLQEAGSSEEFLESVKVDLFPDKVYVFTPKGQILRLPRGATVVDFAYAVHTDIGNRCVAAKVDRRLTPLRTVLRNGQTVEIITAKGATPESVVGQLRGHRQGAQRHPSLPEEPAPHRGDRARLEAARPGTRGILAVARGCRPTRCAAPALGEFGMKDIDELYEKLGLGERLAPLVARRLLPAAPTASGPAGLAPLAIAGTEGLLVTYARCCFPIPNDPIFAFLSTGRGVVIHRETCVNVEDYRKHPEKWLPVSWQTTPDRLFAVGDPRRRGQPHGRAGRGRRGDRQHRNQHRPRLHRGARQRHLGADLRAAGARPAHLARLMRIIRRMPDVMRVTRTIAAHARDAQRRRARAMADGGSDDDRRRSATRAKATA